MLKKQMLIVDDNPGLQVALKTVFEDDFNVTLASSGEEALKATEKSSPNVVIMDYQMPGLDGVQTMQLLRDNTPDSHVIIMSAFDEYQRVRSALRSGAFDFVPKPFDVADIKSIVDHATAEPNQGFNFKPLRRPTPSIITQQEVDEMISQTLRVACGA